MTIIYKYISINLYVYIQYVHIFILFIGKELHMYYSLAYVPFKVSLFLLRVSLRPPPLSTLGETTMTETYISVQ